MASDALRTLKSGAKHVGDLRADLEPPTMTRPGWDAEVYARRSLGDDAKVELWYLAEYFLLAWHDWHTMRDRYRAYFGFEDDPAPFPKAWKKLDEQCQALATLLLWDESLEERVLDGWLMSGTVPHEHAPTLRDVFHVVVENHRRWHLMGLLAAHEAARQPALVESKQRSGQPWSRAPRLVSRLNDAALSAARQLGEPLAANVRHSLRRYRYSTLDFSWLADLPDPDTEKPDWSGSRSESQSGSYGASHSGSRSMSESSGLGESALNQLLAERIVTPSLDQFLNQLEDDNARGTVRHMMERITQAIAELGYDEFVDQVASSDFRGGQQSPVGVSAINLIPSKTSGPCRSLLLAVSKGDKKPLKFSHIMRQVREHLIRCSETKAVVVLCDYWTRDLLEEHLGDLRAHHGRGVRFLFLMAGIPARAIAPVAVDLGLAP